MSPQGCGALMTDCPPICHLGAQRGTAGGRRHHQRAGADPGRAEMEDRHVEDGQVADAVHGPVRSPDVRDGRQGGPRQLVDAEQREGMHRAHVALVGAVAGPADQERLDVVQQLHGALRGQGVVGTVLDVVGGGVGKGR